MLKPSSGPDTGQKSQGPEDENLSEDSVEYEVRVPRDLVQPAGLISSKQEAVTNTSVVICADRSSELLRSGSEGERLPSEEFN